ncbi:TetR/AcrR family transcriptional regulator [Simiduia sp. 21SJ11W-1]|uniref:TetR/AcrR family transcriptional regulator n=1 Tax=Simiduia sp. 21SJ11W-1 TaxID=2909669 RepID=UPI0020A0070C|nr:TetR/AcrR family transcriptional regulator [Simiduia sp. 21SJ11W-1]UTA46406.1 TetR/AcrR family transcriptional regulator [Simiduia sp. 21SJ11W-1]
MHKQEECPLASARVLEDQASAKGRVLRVAAGLFRERGFARTTVRDIAAQVGILSGSLFHHFANKEAILAQLMEELILLVGDAMEAQLCTATTPKARLKVLVACELKAIHGEIGTGFSILVTEWRSLGAASQRQILALREHYEQRWLDCLATLKAQGALAAEPQLARHFIRGAAMETWHWYKPGGPLSVDALADQLVALVVHP